MKGLIGFVLIVAMIACLFPAHAALITVTTTNTVAVAGQTNLTQAIQMLHNGDTIQFDIPGTAGQVQYLPTPPNGYPIITNDNVTIDGYSQPGASPNSLHAPNNAQIKVCLDSRNGNATDMGIIENLIGVPSRPGYSHCEWAVLGVFGGTNVHIRGLAILSAPVVDTGNNDTTLCSGSDCGGDSPCIKSISFARSHDRSCANWHVSGCWIGVDPATRNVAYLGDGTTVASPAIAIAAYRHQDVSGGALPDVYPQPGTIGVAAGSANPRAEFNVIVTGYGFDSEGLNFRISGNFWGVLPDGTTSADMSVLNGGAQLGDGFIEIGRNTSNLIIGTDGDGINDADEGNVFGGFANGGAAIINLYSDPRTNIVIAGNSIGQSAVGSTRFPNSCVIVDGFGDSATARFGSDFDGVSDELEANLVYNNYPPGPAGSTYPRFVELSQGTTLSLRGNTLVNNFTPPVDPTQNLGDLLANYYAKVVADVNAPLVPVLSGGVTTNRLRGQVPLPNSNYPVVMLDVYRPDPEGITNGIAANLLELPNGFIQGKTYLGSFVVDGPADLDPVAGAFEFDISGWAITNGTLLTVTANYSPAPARTHNAPTVTSLFSVPVAAGLTPGISVGPVTRSGSTLSLSWSGGNPPYQVQRRTTFSGGTWVNEGAQTSSTSATVPITGDEGYFRVQSQQ